MRFAIPPNESYVPLLNKLRYFYRFLFFNVRVVKVRFTVHRTNIYEIHTKADGENLQKVIGIGEFDHHHNSVRLTYRTKRVNGISVAEIIDDYSYVDGRRTFSVEGVTRKIGETFEGYLVLQKRMWVAFLLYPYREEGKDFRGLFDVTIKKVRWKDYLREKQNYERDSS